MGMSIDEHIVMLRSYKKLMWGTECDKRYGDTFNFAIETMRKYQQIEQIVKDTQYLCEYGSAFIDIREVVENGKVD